MTDERDPRAIDPMDELRAALEAVAAPEQFAARVHERIGAGRVSGSRFRVPGSRFGIRLGAIAAAVVLLWLSGWQRAGGPVTHVAEAGDVRDAPEIPADGSRAGRIAPDVSSAPPPRNLEPGTRNLEPRFEVLTNQPAILAALWADAIRPARVDVAAPVAVTSTVQDVEIVSVEVSPVVVKWLVDPAPALGFPLPFIVRIAAAEAARRPE